MKKKIIFSALAIVLVGSGLYLKFGTQKPMEEYTTAKLEKTKLLQTVNETGTLKASDEIELNFLNTGKIARLFIKSGDQVKSGDLLAELDHQDLLIRQNEAQANVEIAQASYNKLLAGATSYEISVAQAGVNQSETNFQNALKEFEDSKKTENENLKQARERLNDLTSEGAGNLTAQEQAVALAQTSLANAKSTYSQIVKNREETALKTIDTNLAVMNYALDIIETILTDDDIKSSLGVKNTELLSTAKLTYNSALDLLEDAENSVAKYNAGEVSLDQLIDQNLTALNEAFRTLNQFYTVLEKSVTTVDFSQSELDTKKSSINTQITTVSNAITSLQTAEQNLNDARLAYTSNVNTAEENLLQAQVNLSDAVTTATNQLSAMEMTVQQKITLAQSKVDSAKEALQIAKAQLAQVKAPAKGEDIALQKAQLKQAQASLETAKNNIEKSILKSPIDGIITKINYEIGETVAGKPVISMLNGNALEVEVDISETDISKVSLEDKVEITLDAFTDDLKFNGKVMEIEPAETIIQDVIYYKVHLSVDLSAENLAKVKPGMTANVVITTIEKDDVLVAPSRAIIDKNGEGKFLRVLENGILVEKTVKIGVRGDDGIVEILSDFPEGTEVVTYVKKN